MIWPAVALRMTKQTYKQYQQKHYNITNIRITNLIAAQINLISTRWYRPLDLQTLLPPSCSFNGQLGIETCHFTLVLVGSSR